VSIRSTDDIPRTLVTHAGPMPIQLVYTEGPYVDVLAAYDSEIVLEDGPTLGLSVELLKTGAYRASVVHGEVDRSGDAENADLDNAVRAALDALLRSLDVERQHILDDMQKIDVAFKRSTEGFVKKENE
jgi:hypothetical protein